MVGENQTKNTLKITMQSTRGKTDGVQSSKIRKITILGIGGVGSNILTQLIKASIFDSLMVVIDTDSNHLSTTNADLKILIGKNSTRGNSTNGDPIRGRVAAVESCKKFDNFFDETDILFIIAGLGGGTGTGASPLIAKLATERNITTIGIFIKPSIKNQNSIISRYLSELQTNCQTMITVNIQNLLDSLNAAANSEAPHISLLIISNVIKEVLSTAMSRITAPNFIELRDVIEHGGTASIGICKINNNNQTEKAIREALECSISDHNKRTAKTTLVSITDYGKLTFEDKNHVREIVTDIFNKDLPIRMITSINPAFDGNIQVTIVVVGSVLRNKSEPTLSSIDTPLFNLEPHSSNEQKLNLDLGLYQLENFEN